MGSGVSAQDSLDLLLGLIRGEALKPYGVQRVELHLCAPFTVDADPNITQHGWLPRRRRAGQIAESDVLFLPYSFRQ